MISIHTSRDTLCANNVSHTIDLHKPVHNKLERHMGIEFLTYVILKRETKCSETSSI